MIDASRVDPPRHVGMTKERLDLGGKDEDPARLRPEQRLLPDAIAHEEQPRLLRVPERDRELPVQAMDEVEPVLLVEVRDRLGVAARLEAVPGPERAPLAAP